MPRLDRKSHWVATIADSVEEARHRADFLVLALHLKPDTIHLVDADFIAAMKPGSYLVNPARGSLVDESAVHAAVADGRLAGYAADTFEMEDWSLPGRPEHIHEGLLENDRTVLTPHIGSAVSAVREQIELSAAKSILAVANGKVPDTAVNRPTMPFNRPSGEQV